MGPSCVVVAICNLWYMTLDGSMKADAYKYPMVPGRVTPPAPTLLNPLVCRLKRERTRMSPQGKLGSLLLRTPPSRLRDNRHSACISHSPLEGMAIADAECWINLREQHQSRRWRGGEFCKGARWINKLR